MSAATQFEPNPDKIKMCVNALMQILARPLKERGRSAYASGMFPNEAIAQAMTLGAWAEAALWQVPPVHHREIWNGLEALIEQMRPKTEITSNGHSADLAVRIQGIVDRMTGLFYGRSMTAQREGAETHTLELLAQAAALSALSDLALELLAEDIRPSVPELAAQVKAAVKRGSDSPSTPSPPSEA